MGSTDLQRTAGATVPEHWPHAAVLVVDDEPGMRHFLEKTLAPRAGQVFAAASAEEAEALLRRHRFNLVILDISMPGKSGMDVLRTALKVDPSCTVLVLTGFGSVREATEAVEEGAFGLVRLVGLVGLARGLALGLVLWRRLGP